MDDGGALSTAYRRLLGSAVAFVLGALLYVVREAPPVVIHHGSDALFASSVALFFAAVWDRDRAAWSVGLAFVLGLEALQATSIVPGTFDVGDLIAEAAAYVITLGIALRVGPRAAPGVPAHLGP